jgi:ligand-binding sensor domain-containing protein
MLTMLLKASLLLGQSPYFQSYHPLSKNIGVEANTLFQDHDGFIWLGTDHGLFRFDGQRYEQFLSTDSLVGNSITAVAEDSVGRIWIGHTSGQLSYLENGVLHSFEPDEGSAAAPVSDIVFDRRGNMWFSTLNDGLYYYVKGRLYRADDAEGLPDLYIYDLFEDADGNIWAGTDRGIAVCSLVDRKINIDVIDGSDGLPDVIIKKIRTFSGDTIAIATEDAGIVIFDSRTRKLKPLVDGAWTYGAISDFVVKENQVWMAVPGRGLGVYDRLVRRTKIFKAYDEEESLQSINALLKDREGNIWSASKTGIARTAGDAVEHLESLAPCTDINILALAVDHKDRIWFSTSEGLFMRTYKPGGAAVVEQPLKGTAFAKANIISLYEDSDGFIWAGLYGNGLLRIDPATGRVVHLEKELRNGNILSITGKDHTIWVGTLGGSSSITRNGDGYTVKNYSSGDGLSSDFIYQVFIDSQNRKWFATDGKGVSMLDKTGFHHFTEGLASKVVYSISEDIDHNLWVSSQNNGVYLFNGSKFATVPGMRLRETAIQSLATDRFGDVIAVHDFGVDVYNVNEKRIRYWGEETGIRQKRPNLNAIATDKYGQIFIGTSKGIIKFSLSNEQLTSLPQPVIEEVRVFDDLIDISSPPQLKYDESNLTFHYVAFWYQDAENLNYQYKLDNYDLEWIATRNQDVTYSKLPPGDYIFEVRASDTNDFAGAPVTTLAFTIDPPFWRTSGFYLFVVALFVITFYGFIKFRERRLMEDKLILEARVEERTREIQQKTEEIQAQNEEIMAQAEEIQGINENLEMLVKQRTAELEKKNKALEEYAFINAHKLRSPVASILGLLNLLSKTELKQESKVIHDHLVDSAEKLDAVVRSITETIEKADRDR